MKIFPDERYPDYSLSGEHGYCGLVCEVPESLAARYRLSQIEYKSVQDELHRLYVVAEKKDRIAKAARLLQGL